MKKYMNSAIVYAVMAMAGGVFYREITRYMGFTGKTALSVVHTHYFILGMFFFLLLMVLEKNFEFTEKKTRYIICAYHAGLNLTCLMFVVRGLAQVFEMNLSAAAGASISGLAGTGHIILGISMVLILVEIRKSTVKR